jgi:NitT/TauT family transport system substrate-binding protein
MQKKSFWLTWVTVISLVGACLVGGTPTLAKARPTTKKLVPISFSVDFIIDGRYAPWYVALYKGYYRAAGLDVSIEPGNGSEGVLQRLASGVNQFVFADFGGLALASANSGAKDKMVAVLYAKPPYAIYSLKREHLTALKDFEGKTIATNTGSPVHALFNILALENHLQPSAFHWIEVDPSTKVQLLATSKVDAAENYIMSQPLFQKATAAEGGINTFLLSSLGLSTYSNGIVVSDQYLKAHPAIVRAFVQASLEGFRYAFAHPLAAAQLMQAHFPTLSVPVIEQQIEILKSLAYGPGTAAHGLGYMDPATVVASLRTIAKVYNLKRIPSPTSLYTNAFLPGSR